MLLAKPLEFKFGMDGYIHKSIFSHICRLRIFKLTTKVQENVISFPDTSMGITCISDQITKNVNQELR